MKKNLMFISAMAAALLLGACSGGGNSGATGGTSGGGDTGGTSGGDTTSEAPHFTSASLHEEYVPSGEYVTITVSGGETEAAQAYLNVVGNEFSYYWAEKFPDYPEVVVDVIALSESGVKDAWLQDLSNAPDFSIAADDQLADLITANGLQPLTSALYQFDPEAIKTRNSESSVQLCTYDDTLYAFPVSASNGYFLYYDARKLSLDDVSTFDKLLAAIDRESNKDGKNYTFGFSNDSGWYLDGWFRGAGYNVQRMSDGTNSTCDWNSTTKTPTGVDVAGALLKLTNGEHKGHWFAGSDTTCMTMVADGTTDQVIATVNGVWSADAIKTAWGEGAAATKLPTYNINGTDYQMYSVAGCKVGIVNAVTGNAAYAAQFGEYMTNAYNQWYRYNALAEAPTNIEASGAVDLSANYAVGALAQQLAVGGFVQQVGGGYWTPSGALAGYLASGVNGDVALVNNAGTANVTVNTTALQSLLNETVAGITGTAQ